MKRLPRLTIHRGATAVVAILLAASLGSTGCRRPFSEKARRLLWAEYVSLSTQAGKLRDTPNQGALDRQMNVLLAQVDRRFGLSRADLEGLGQEAEEKHWLDSETCRIPAAPLEGNPVVVPPVLTSPLAPVSTPIACRAGIRGAVLLSAVVDDQGKLRDLEVVKGLGSGLDEQALDAAAHGSWLPALLCGRPVTGHFKLSVAFRDPCADVDAATRSAAPSSPAP